MGEKTDQIKGRAKEAVGDVTDNKDLQHEGKADRLGGEAKEKVSDVKDKATDAVDKVKEKLQH